MLYWEPEKTRGPPRMSTMEIRPASRPLDATVVLPGSKSYTNRALLIAAMAQGESVLRQASFSDDTDYMAGALRTLGIQVEEDRQQAEFRVAGADGSIPVREASLFVGNAGTAARFLTRFVALGHSTYTIDGARS